LGLLLSAPTDVAPKAGDAFVVVDGSLRVCAVSRAAEKVLGAGEPGLVGRPLHELLIPADAEPSGASSLAEHVIGAATGDEPTGAAFVRPAGVFGVRFEARIAPCGPGSAAVLVLR
jgi:PAS domain-containing protein